MPPEKSNCAPKNSGFLLSVFPFNLGLPLHMMFFHSVLFSMSFSLTPTSFISFLLHLEIFSLASLFPSNSISIILLPTYSWSLFMICPYHLSLPSLIFICNLSILTIPLMYSLLIFSCHSHSKPQHFPSLPLVSLLSSPSQIHTPLLVSPQNCTLFLLL